MTGILCRSRRRRETLIAAAAPAIAIRALCKDYGKFTAIAGIDLEIEHGEVFALLGPNGAGKTTLVEILEGYRRRTSGDALVLGVDPAHSTRDWRARLGIVLQTSGQFEGLSVEESIAHFATFYPAPMSVDHVIGMVGLDAKRKARWNTLSGGQKRRLDLAVGLIGDPELIFLDEPTTGFDPGARRQAWDVVRQLTSLGKTVVLTTHYLDEAEALADRVAVIVAGQIVEVSTPRELGGRSRAEAHVAFVATAELAGAALPEVSGQVTNDGSRYVVVTGYPTAVVAQLTAWASDHGASEIPELAVTRPSLEDTYLEMIATRQAAEAGEAS
ncbi:MAG: ABC transporter ATP-binding protein [Ilumatobacteraceae bacterium]